MIKRLQKGFALSFAAIVSLGFIDAASSARASDGPHVEPIKATVVPQITEWLSDPVVIAAIKAKNAQTASLTQAEIDDLDKRWRAEVGASSRPLIDPILSNELSAFLARKQEAAGGLLTEIFIMDARGLNVGQSEITTDYWQGDEAKWQKTFLVGPNAIFIDDIERDDSTQILQAQLSMSITDETGAVIGAITLGVDVDAL